MEIKDLRIGNYVIYNNKEIGFISGIQDFFINNGKVCINQRIDVFYHIENIKPIPLTNNWIKKLFNFNITEGTTYLFDEETPIIYFKKNGNNLKIIKKIGVIETKIKYVHEIQNLYYLLLDRELTIKL